MYNFLQIFSKIPQINSLFHSELSQLVALILVAILAALVVGLLNKSNKLYFSLPTLSDAKEAARHVISGFPEAGKELEIILANVADGITVQDKAGKLIYVNFAAAKLMD